MLDSAVGATGCRHRSSRPPAAYLRRSPSMESGSEHDASGDRRRRRHRRRPQDEQPRARRGLRRRRMLPEPDGPDEAATDQAPAAQAALRGGHPRPRRAGLRLLDLRDHDGRRPGPALPGEPRAVRPLAELGRLRRQRRQARHADQQPGPDLRRQRPDRAGDEGGGGRDRGPALLRAPRRRLPGHRPRRRRRHLLRLGGPGRLDDHPAVRQERARRAERAGPCSRSFARRRSPTTSSASGTRTRSSPST